MSKRAVIASAIAAAIAAPSLASAQAPVAAPSFKAEKCYGIAKAGKNDCASTGNNSCGGSSKISADPKAWGYGPEGYCDRIVNASRTHKTPLSATSNFGLHIWSEPPSLARGAARRRPLDGGLDEQTCPYRFGARGRSRGSKYRLRPKTCSDSGIRG